MTLLHSSVPERRTGARLPWVLASALLAVLAAYGGYVLQQVQMAPGTVLAEGALLVPRQAGHELRNPDVMMVASGPQWSELNATQQRALQPLKSRWALLSEVQKRHWLALAQTFTTLPEAEQTKLHNRMTEWASLSAQQRNQARLNFATANKLAPDNKRAQWEAYQALSDEEKRQLAAKAAPRPKGAATALHPVSSRKLVQVPAATASNADLINPPKIPRPRAYPAAVLPETKPSLPPAPIMVEATPVSVPSSTVIQTLPPLAESNASPAPAPAASTAPPAAEKQVPILPRSAYGH